MKSTATVKSTAWLPNPMNMLGNCSLCPQWKTVHGILWWPPDKILLCVQWRYFLTALTTLFTCKYICNICSNFFLTTVIWKCEELKEINPRIGYFLSCHCLKKNRLSTMESCLKNNLTNHLYWTPNSFNVFNIVSFSTSRVFHSFSRPRLFPIGWRMAASNINLNPHSLGHSSKENMTICSSKAGTGDTSNTMDLEQLQHMINCTVKVSNIIRLSSFIIIPLSNIIFHLRKIPKLNWASRICWGCSGTLKENYRPEMSL